MIYRCVQIVIQTAAAAVPAPGAAAVHVLPAAAIRRAIQAAAATGPGC